MKFLFILLLISAVVVLGQKPPNPRIPETFEATGELTLIETNQTLVAIGRWGIDQPKGKGVKHFEFGHRAPHKNIQEILRYDMGKAFRVEHGQNTPVCHSTNVKPPMPTEWLWARSAYFNGTETIRGQKLNMWVSNDTDKTEKTVGVTQDNPNVPVYLQVKGDLGTLQIVFYNFASRQPNPDWFDVPAICNSTLKGKTIPKSSLKTLIEKANNAKNVNVTLPTSVCDKAASLAKKIAGSCHCPYVYGGETDCCGGHSGGLDCSGLVQYSYTHSGDSSMPRTTFEMWDQLKNGCGECSPQKTSTCHVGDLFFYYPSSSGPDHVVMYIGGGYVAECPHTGEDCHVIRPYFSPYVGCRRVC